MDFKLPKWWFVIYGVTVHSPWRNPCFICLWTLSATFYHKLLAVIVLWMLDSVICEICISRFFFSFNLKKRWVGQHQGIKYAETISLTITSFIIKIQNGYVMEHVTHPPLIGHCSHYSDIIMSAMANHQPHYCLLNHLFRFRSKKTSKLHITGLCEGNSLVTGEFPTQMASNEENVSIWWHHHGYPVI